ncbi:MAG: YdeI/OmpD-associated family protein [Deltaproteobacteria bacterium]|nr:YdeI/OmpD-associated family protein [Deltaproteobacteria bacterium]
MPKKSAAAAYPQVKIATRAALRAWLRENHARSKGAWLLLRKRSAGGSVAWNDIVEEVLCFGWIDSLPRKVDDEHTSLLVTPRKPKSKWSAKNKRHVAELEAKGLLHAAGRAVIARSKEDGTWDALDQVSALVVPPDLAKAFSEYPGSRAHWEGFPPSARRGILEWIDGARRSETREKRILETAREAALGRRANQWPRG